MLKINLLPAYVVERRKVKAFWWLSAVALAVEVLVLGFLWNQQKTYLGQLKQAESTKSSEASQVQTLQKDAETEKGKNQPFQNVIKFIEDTKESPRRQARLLRELSKYIYWKALVQDIDVSDGQNVRLSCAAESVDDYARFAMNFIGCPLFDQTPIFSGIGGDSGGGGMGMAGMPGMGGAMGGMPTSMMPGMPAGGPGGGMMGDGGGAGTQGAAADTLPIRFTVMAHLAPQWQSKGIPVPTGDVTVTGGGGAGGGAMGGMMGGAMGGMMPGMPGGMGGAGPVPGMMGGSGS